MTEKAAGNPKAVELWSKNINVLIADGDKDGSIPIVKALGKFGFRAFWVESAYEAFKFLRDNQVDLILTDINLADLDSRSFLSGISRVAPGLPVIVMTTLGSIQEAVDTMRTGAFDYITKPVNVADLRARIEKAISVHNLSSEVTTLRHAVATKKGFPTIIGTSTAINDIYDKIAQVAPTKASILILGETGTGKEVIARAIHAASQRAAGPFVGINCSAFPETLLESELFGSDKGSYTGSTADREGKFELADHGTLFLDEVGEVSIPTQIKLLRALEEREFYRIGGRKPITVDIRLISATNRDLDEEVRVGRFREDFYYRLKVITVQIPPLRDRKEDIPLLANYFAQGFAVENGKRISGIEPRLMQRLMDYRWPGNIREMKNVIESMVILAKGSELTAKELPITIRNVHSDTIALGRPLAEIEKDAIVKTLASVGGNRTRAAQILKIGLRTLHRKIKEYGLG